jgi:hypothetical protein
MNGITASFQNVFYEGVMVCLNILDFILHPDFTLRSYILETGSLSTYTHKGT